ncbi:MAG: hypothetical protein WKF71_13440 [Pyrinomonadaceae bacterium]
MIIACYSSAISAQDDGEIIKVESSLVVLNATIIDDKGKSVSGLTQSKFKIFEDGKEQEITFLRQRKLLLPP